jgi:CRP/FNR family cyclic AMP-dependent transcriptional regulator
MGVRLDILAKESESQRFEPRQVIFEEGEAGTVMYVVIDGEVEVRLGGRIVETLGPGEPFGEMALIDHAPRVATVVAKTPCRLAVIPERRFLAMIQGTPDFALQIMRVMADRLRKMDALEFARTRAS